MRGGEGKGGRDQPILTYFNVVFSSSGRQHCEILLQFGVSFFEVLALKCDRMALCRDMVAKALAEKAGASGFDAFERALITGSAAISHAYDAYWAAWMKAVQHPALKAALGGPTAQTEKMNNAQRDLTRCQTESPLTRVSNNSFAIQ